MYFWKKKWRNSSLKTQCKLLNFSKLIKYLPPRNKQAHKGDFGYVVVIGGNKSMVGAPILAAQAAYRVGAGIVKVLTHPDHAVLPSLVCPEIQAEGIESVGKLNRALARASVIVLGPGLGQDKWAKMLFQAVLRNTLPLVIDADALRLLAQTKQVRDNWVLTPHAGEAEALLGLSVLKINAEREKAALALQACYGGVVVLKGYPSLIANKDLSYCAQGNPGMATAGMGDVLSGVIGGLLAQGLTPVLAAQLGVVLHAKAGDSAAKLGGERGMIASDLFPFLRRDNNSK